LVQGNLRVISAHNFQYFEALTRMRGTSSFQEQPTQVLIDTGRVVESWAGPETSQASSWYIGGHREVTSYHGAIHRRKMRLQKANAQQIQPIRDYYDTWQDQGGEPPPYILAFVNSKSGNQKVSQAIKDQLKTLLGHKFRKTGGGEVYLAGDVCELGEARSRPDHVRNAIRDTKRSISARSLRFLVCGGDGTVTWVLQEIECCRKENPLVLSREDPDPPIGIVPTGTGNDLSRSLGWGTKLKRVADLCYYVQWVLAGDVVLLDQWKTTLRFEGEADEDALPPAFHRVAPGLEEYFGYFQNYFSVGMDAAVMYGFERVRRSCIGKICFTLGLGKCCFCMQSYRSGACSCCCSRLLSIRNNSLQVAGAAAEQARVFGREELGGVRQVLLLNINSYASGRVPLSRKDLDSMKPSDGHLELFCLQGVLDLGTMVAGCSAEVVGQPAHFQMTLDEGEYYQMDGEAWRMDVGCTVDIQLNRKVRMLRPPTCPQGIWSVSQVPGFWHSQPARVVRRSTVRSVASSSSAYQNDSGRTGT